MAGHDPASVGQFAELSAAVLKALAQRGLTRVEVQYLIDHPGVLLAEIAGEGGLLSPPRRIGPLTVKVRDAGFSEMFAACGFDIGDPHIDQGFYFPKRGGYDADMMLVGFNRWVSVHELPEFWQRNWMRPANVRELLAFAAAYPDLQRVMWILSLDVDYIRNSPAPAVVLSDDRTAEPTPPGTLRQFGFVCPRSLPIGKGAFWSPQANFLTVKQYR